MGGFGFGEFDGFGGGGFFGTEDVVGVGDPAGDERVYSLHTSYGKIAYPLPPKSASSASLVVNDSQNADLTIVFPDTDFQDIWRVVVSDPNLGFTYAAFNYNFDSKQTVKVTAPPDIVFDPNTVFAVTCYNVLGEPSEPVYAFDPAGLGITTAANQICSINVLDFGAVGDGIADDTLACQAAIDAATGPGDPFKGINIVREVLFPCGYSFRVTPQVQIAHPDNVDDTGSYHLEEVDNWACLIVSSVGFTSKTPLTSARSFPNGMQRTKIKIMGNILIDPVDKDMVWGFANNAAMEGFSAVVPANDSCIDFVEGTGRIQPCTTPPVHDTYKIPPGIRVCGIWFDQVLDGKIEDLNFYDMSVAIRVTGAVSTAGNGIFGGARSQGTYIRRNTITVDGSILPPDGGGGVGGPNGPVIGIEMCGTSLFLIQDNKIDFLTYGSDTTRNACIRLARTAEGAIIRNLLANVTGPDNIDDQPQFACILLDTPVSSEIDIIDNFITYEGGIPPTGACIAILAQSWPPAGPFSYFSKYSLIKILGNGDTNFGLSALSGGFTRFLYAEGMTQSQVCQNNSFGDLFIKDMGTYNANEPSVMHSVRFRDNFWVGSPDTVLGADGLDPANFSPDSIFDDWLGSAGSVFFVGTGPADPSNRGFNGGGGYGAPLNKSVTVAYGPSPGTGDFTVAHTLGEKPTNVVLHQTSGFVTYVPSLTTDSVVDLNDTGTPGATGTITLIGPVQTPPATNALLGF